MESGLIRFVKKQKASLVVVGIFVVFIAVSSLCGIPEGTAAAGRFAGFLLEFAFFLPPLFVLIGLFDVWIPRSFIERHLGRASGWRGVLWVSLLAMLQAGPLYASFPVAYALWKKGCHPRNIFIYLGAFSTLKLPMLFFESGFLGVKFTLLRTALSVPVFILVGLLMAARRGFTMRNPADDATPTQTSLPGGADAVNQSLEKDGRAE